MGNPADERVILFSAISSSDNLRLGIGLGLGLGSVSVLIAGLTSTFRTPATCFSQWQNNITRSSAGLPNMAEYGKNIVLLHVCSLCSNQSLMSEQSEHRAT